MSEVRNGERYCSSPAFKPDAPLAERDKDRYRTLEKPQTGDLPGRFIDFCWLCHKPTTFILHSCASISREPNMLYHHCHR